MQLFNEVVLHPDFPRQVNQDELPCEIHDLHRPVTVINELHHIFPQYLQKEVWGEVRDQRMVSLCATGHNTVTYAWQLFTRKGYWPRFCIGRTRDVCELGWARYQEALKSA